MLYKTCTICKSKILINEKCGKCTNNRNARYDRFNRNLDSKDFYNSMEWRKIREIVLDKHNYLDVFELKINKRIVKADTVHHIEPLIENEAKALDINNLIPVSNRVHNVIHGVYDKSNEKKRELQCLLKSLIGGYSQTQ